MSQKPQGNSHDSHTEREWQKKFFGMGKKCYYCGSPLLLKDATKDHRIPRCRGGSSNIRNIVPSCLPCNQKKGWRTEREFLALRQTFAQNPDSLAGNTTLEPTRKPAPAVNFELINNPYLLFQLRRESESVSWAWRNPV